MEQQAYSYLPDVSMDPVPEPSMFAPMAPRINKDQELRLMIEDAKLAKNTGETMFNTTLERKRRAADMAVIDPIAQDHRERIRQQEEIANKITNVITPQMADEQAKAQAAQQQQQQLMGQLMGMQAPEQKRGQMGIADILSAGIAALFGGAQGVNQAIEGGYQRAGQDAQMQFQNEGRQFEQQQQNIMLQLQQLGLDEKTAQHAFDVLQGRQWGLEDQKRNAEADAIKLARDDEQTLWNRYLQANSPDEKEFIGGELVRRGKMNPEFVSNAVADMRTKEQGAKRDRVMSKLLQYVTDPAERQKLAQWAANMTPGDLDVAVGLSDAELLKRAQTAKTNVETQFLEKTLDDRVNIIASNKGIKDAQLQIIKKDLQFYDADRAIKVATARARIAALNRSNGVDAYGNPVEKPLTPAEERQREQNVLSSTKELAELAKEQLLKVAPTVDEDGKTLTEDQRIAAVLGMASNPISGLWVKPVLNDYNEAVANYDRLLRRQASGGAAPLDMGMGNPNGPLLNPGADFPAQPPVVGDIGGGRKVTPVKAKPKAKGGNVSESRARGDAKAAIAQGADPAAVRKAFKQMTGKDY